jgi:FkbM family methyltransferase
MDIATKEHPARRSVRRRTTKHEVLRDALKLGFRPLTVIDVGVGNGTPWLYKRSDEANLLLVEPLIEYKPVLDSIVRKARNAQYVLAAAGSEVGMKTISLCSEWLEASSIYHGPTASSIRKVPVTTLDKLCAELHLTGPYLIKVDVEGAELDVLDGAQRILEDTQLVFLEVSFFEYFIGAPLFDDVVRYMKERDFGIYDIVDRQHRALRDGRSLSKADVAFVKEGSKFRPSTPTWSARLHA